MGALGVTDIVLCGHSHCGAMTGVLQPETLTDLPATRTWLEHAEATRRLLMENYAELTGEDRLNVAIQENVLVQLENLRTLPVVAERLAGGRLHLHGWVYKIETGEVFSYDPGDARFHALGQYQPKPTQPHGFTSLPAI